MVIIHESLKNIRTTTHNNRDVWHSRFPEKSLFRWEIKCFKAKKEVFHVNFLWMCVQFGLLGTRASLSFSLGQNCDLSSQIVWSICSQLSSCTLPPPIPDWSSNNCIAVDHCTGLDTHKRSADFTASAVNYRFAPYRFDRINEWSPKNRVNRGLIWIQLPTVAEQTRVGQRLEPF